MDNVKSTTKDIQRMDTICFSRVGKFSAIVRLDHVARQKILCKRFSTKSRIFRRKYAQFGLLPLSTVLPGGVRRYARRNGVNAVAARRGILTQGN